MICMMAKQANTVLLNRRSPPNGCDVMSTGSREKSTGLSKRDRKKRDH
jgi:hypothetical protein